MNRVVLLGGSIFDYAIYVADGPDVRTQREAQLPPDWRVTLLIVDGHQTSPCNHRLDQSMQVN
jgi:hypothetical protein